MIAIAERIEHDDDLKTVAMIYGLGHEKRLQLVADLRRIGNDSGNGSLCNFADELERWTLAKAANGKAVAL